MSIPFGSTDTVDQAQLEAWSVELAKHIKDKQDIAALSRQLLTDRSALKVVYLAIERAAQKWTVPVKDWKLALNRFAIEFEDRMLIK